MDIRSISKDDEIAQLRRQLATAEERLERAQSFAFDLRCFAARREQRGFWMKEDDRSGMRAAIWKDTEDMGDWTYVKAKDVPEPTPTPFTSPARDLPSELGFAHTCSSFSKPFPPELFYHLIDYSSQSTLLALCLVSSSIRAIASPRLYETMVVTSASQLRHFLPDPLAPLAPFNPSLTLHRVLSLDLIVPYGHNSKLVQLEEMKANTYMPVPLPRLRHLFLRAKYRTWTYVDEDLETIFLSSGPEWKENINILQSIWTRSTSNWNALKHISFVDVGWLYTYEWAEQVGGSTTHRRPFSPSHLPTCDPSVSLSWTFTQQIGGYAKSSGTRNDLDEQSPLMDICDGTAGVGDWPFVREFGIQLEIGDGPKDRAAYEEDMQELPEEWDGRVHYRGDGRSESSSGPA